jgi:hypothetical protein
MRTIPIASVAAAARLRLTSLHLCVDLPRRLSLKNYQRAHLDACYSQLGPEPRRVARAEAKPTARHDSATDSTDDFCSAPERCVFKTIRTVAAGYPAAARLNLRLGVLGVFLQYHPEVVILRRGTSTSQTSLTAFDVSTLPFLLQSAIFARVFASLILATLVGDYHHHSILFHRVHP